MKDRNGQPMVDVGGVWVGRDGCLDGDEWRPTESLGEVTTSRLLRVQLDERDFLAHAEREMGRPE